MCNETQGDASDFLNFNPTNNSLALNTNVTQGYDESFCFICSNLNKTENVTIRANQTDVYFFNCTERLDAMENSTTL